MSTARVKRLDLLPPPVVETAQTRSLVVGAIFGIVAVIFGITSPDQFFRSYLLAYMLWLGVALGCLAFLMIQHLTGGTWGAVIQRMLEAGCGTMPLMAVLFVPIVIGMRRLYIWTDPAFQEKEEHLKVLSQHYLNPSGFVIRAVIYFAIWLVLIYALRSWSREQDDPPVRQVSKLRALSAPGLVLFALSVSFAVIDWVMSLTPPWISTIYPMIFIVGQCLTALCFVVAVAALLYKYQPMSTLLKGEDVADLGKLMLAFVMLWAYFNFSQLLIIWAGNLPEEIPFFARRFVGGWQQVGVFLALFHFAIPFVLLLSRGFKRNPRRLVKLALWLFVACYIDLHWYIGPVFHASVYYHWLDLAVPVAMGGLWLALFFRNLKGRPLLPAYDPQVQALMEPAHD
jgi:hypothetical protein